jgi:carboxyl-terminal processing protease
VLLLLFPIVLPPQAYAAGKNAPAEIDLRNNSGGLLTASIEVAEQFIEANKVIVTLKGRGRTGKSEEYLSKHKDVLEGLPLILLVNSGSASGSEIVAGALQDWGRAMIVGTPSYGRGNVQTLLPLSDGSGLRLTTAVYYTPKGRPINQQSKIQPDSIIEEREGEDLPLSFAIEQLLGKMGA